MEELRGTKCNEKVNSNGEQKLGISTLRRRILSESLIFFLFSNRI